MSIVKALDPKFVSEEFNRRALERQGIDKVLSARFGSDVNAKFDQDVRVLLEKHFPDRLGSVLEIGVGIGRIAQYIAARSDRYVGVDFSKEMLSHASHSLRHTDNVHLVLADGNSLNFPAKSFDLGIVCLVLKHNNDIRAAELVEKLKLWCKKILLIDHVSGGATGSNIAVVRSTEWYIQHFQPMKSSTVEHFKRHEDNIVFAVFE